MQQRIERSLAEIAQLKNQITAYENLFIRHDYNTHARGISEAELAMPLPIDRGRTDRR